MDEATSGEKLAGILSGEVPAAVESSCAVSLESEPLSTLAADVATGRGGKNDSRSSGD